MGLPYPIPGPVHVDYVIEIDQRPGIFTRTGPFMYHMPWATRAKAQQLRADLLHHPDVLDARIVQERRRPEVEIGVGLDELVHERLAAEPEILRAVVGDLPPCPADAPQAKQLAPHVVGRDARHLFEGLGHEDDETLRIDDHEGAIVGLEVKLTPGEDPEERLRAEAWRTAAASSTNGG